MNLIIPVCGKSSRFPRIRPKFLLTAPSGNSMLAESIKELPYPKNLNIYLVALTDHDRVYKFAKGILKQVAKYFPNNVIQWVFLDGQTRNQPETVYKAIKQADIQGQILIKDCDNCFEIDSFPQENFVAVDNLHNHTNINAANKSYAMISDKGWLENIVEKKIVSEWFCTGLYSFATAASFCAYYEDIMGEAETKFTYYNENFYISNIIYRMLLDNIAFSIKEVKNFIDFGTLTEWNKYCRSFMNIEIDLDGCLVEASCPYMKPLCGTTAPLKNNVKFINRKYNEGRTHVVVKTARPEAIRELTEDQLKEVGLQYHYLIMGAFHAPRFVVNDFASTNLYPAASAINLPRNSDNLEYYFDN